MGLEPTTFRAVNSPPRLPISPPRISEPPPCYARRRRSTSLGQGDRPRFDHGVAVCAEQSALRELRQARSREIVAPLLLSANSFSTGRDGGTGARRVLVEPAPHARPSRHLDEPLLAGLPAPDTPRLRHFAQRWRPLEKTRKSVSPWWRQTPTKRFSGGVRGPRRSRLRRLRASLRSYLRDPVPDRRDAALEPWRSLRASPAPNQWLSWARVRRPRGAYFAVPFARAVFRNPVTDRRWIAVRQRADLWSDRSASSHCSS